ncbi:putative tyrosine specific protein phosphatase [Leishmania major strain Friedlin]|uniref:Putative tyrosine specific protein phosphatase n=1 Tax=Leishmania major TaxID=5664 RepID=Q4Q0M4_LEIMA|nr:putative tyrosine specific protein phosphatase [Leishmania major strain Friedlin]CAG9584090.1 tyrosine_specific_protein_phosphatase_-_putative [Leishmania major strain Friedlin]CAJ09510.1 putative tyrosine specific protein phosphatase [Leishmania major strain Friedlin]|eukprot:XP_001687124.1 putative tyrosine specific protein phosphatase [Leishmania major strain Friedlin]
MCEKQLKEKQRFDVHLRRLGERVYPSTEDGFDRELAKLRRIDACVRSNLDEYYSASLGSSMAKNRFSEVKPNEGTIVRLSETGSQGDGTYINANFIDAREKFKVPFVYIATQAPMKNSVLDFWRMVYENDSAFIVMLCAVKENGKIKSETYWPPRGAAYDMGVLSVTLVAENMRPDSVHRRLLLRSVRGDEKEVYHMQYVAWPDQGVPQSSVTLMEMINTIAKSPRSTQSPIVVHCSGGIGRTGVFIGLHIALAQFQLGQANINIPCIVRHLKACRTGMVQRKDQYIFLYYAVQREMERMLLSQKAGVNLLDSRSRLAAAAATRAEPAPTQIASPLIMPMPVQTRGRHMFSIFAPLRSSTSANPTELRSTPIQVPENRNAEDDAATLENYLQAVGSSPSLGRSPSLSNPVDRSFSVEALHHPFRQTSLSPPSLSNSIPREPDVHRRQVGTSRSSTSYMSESATPLLRATSLLREELARQQQANRVKRFSPSFV